MKNNFSHNILPRFCCGVIAFVTAGVFLFASCAFDQFDEDDPFETDVEYSDTWRYITIILGDKDPPDDDMIMINNNTQTSRAMTQDSARRSFDYFEVAFAHNEIQENNGTYVTRMDWAIGKKAYINKNKLYRPADYSSTSVNETDGSSILFAGRKSDKTLLAVGKLRFVDDVETGVITESSQTVTFELFALTASAAQFTNDIPDPSTSSFLTGAGGTAYTDISVANTKIIPALIRNRRFPLYWLPAGASSVSASYTFVLAGGFVKGENPIIVDWDDFAPGIKVGQGRFEDPPGGNAGTYNARYPIGNGKYWFADYIVDQTTKVEMINNRHGSNAQNPVTFNIDTSETIDPEQSANGIFTLWFEIPVYALHEALKNNLWFIRPAFTTYRFNIDNGTDSTGGGLLMGVEAQDDFDIGARWG